MSALSCRPQAAFPGARGRNSGRWYVLMLIFWLTRRGAGAFIGLCALPAAPSRVPKGSTHLPGQPSAGATWDRCGEGPPPPGRRSGRRPGGVSLPAASCGGQPTLCTTALAPGVLSFSRHRDLSGTAPRPLSRSRTTSARTGSQSAWSPGGTGAASDTTDCHAVREASANPDRSGPAARPVCREPPPDGQRRCQQKMTRSRLAINAAVSAKSPIPSMTAVTGDRLAGAPLPFERVAQVNECRRKVRPEHESPAQAGDRRVQAPLFLQRCAQVVERCRIVRHQGQGAAVADDRLVRVPKVLQRHAQIVERVRIAWPEGSGPCAGMRPPRPVTPVPSARCPGCSMSPASPAGGRRPFENRRPSRPGVRPDDVERRHRIPLERPPVTSSVSRACPAAFPSCAVGGSCVCPLLRQKITGARRLQNFSPKHSWPLPTFRCTLSGPGLSKVGIPNVRKPAGGTWRNWSPKPSVNPA